MQVKERFQSYRHYMDEYGDEIAVRNLQLMSTVCVCGITLFTLYYLITFFFFKSQMISYWYALIVPVLIISFIYIRKTLKKGSITYKNTQALTVYMYLLLMVYCIVMSVLAHPELNAIYYPLFLVLAPVILIMPSLRQAIINLCSYAFFFALVILVKPQALWMHDLFESFTALLFSFIVILLMMQFRVQSDSLMSKYYLLSRNDGLTGLLNKTVGSETARAYIEGGTSGEPFALLLMDVDDFKNINDTFGHECGDMTLKKLGQTLKDAFASEDVLSRYGGDEFMVLMKNVTPDECESRVSGLGARVAGCCEGKNFTLSVSVGIYTGVCGGIPMDTAMKKADLALYLVKQQGKNAHLFYGETK